MASREDLPRISVDKVEDWKRVGSNCNEAAASILDEEIRRRRLESERDALNKHMQEFISRTMLVAQPNLRVNGNSFDSLDAQDTETFDEALDRRIWSLADTRFQWDKRITENRKNVPGEIAASVSQALQQHQQFDNEELEEGEIEVPEDSGDAIPGLELVTESVLKTSALTKELSQTIRKQQERSERVKVVSAEVKALRS
ncbi:hypothetical protein FA15DRAFT_290184 [Coprinopsis marcescibilis]|uniref:Uncharacterized protein n=1 Tax=Coprinopsis marcescibilis TaxID=230819 RepID=A0A5C3L2D4_COPMA|nr:hypothetical protein FA15DRAFT_290184 [Coprinopsis marcescibilis]